MGIESEPCAHSAETADGTCSRCGTVLPPAGTTWRELDGAEATALAEAALRARSHRLARSLISARDENNELVSTGTLVGLQQGRCGICGGELDWDAERGPEQAMQRGHIDHIVPLEVGGRHVIANLQMTHAACNLGKGSQFLDKCSWPPEREVSPARAKERATAASRNAVWEEYWSIATDLALTPRQVMHIEIANTWERLPVRQKTQRWRAWLAYLGPAPTECAKGMGELRIGEMKCGEVSDLETVNRGLWTVADVDRGDPPPPPYPGWSEPRA